MSEGQPHPGGSQGTEAAGLRDEHDSLWAAFALIDTLTDLLRQQRACCGCCPRCHPDREDQADEQALHEWAPREDHYLPLDLPI